MYPNLNTGVLGVRANYHETLDLAARNGFRGVDVSITELQELAAEQGVDAIQAAAEGAGVRLAAFGLPVQWRQDEAAWRAGLVALPAQARLAQELGVQRTTTWIMPGDDERPYAENYAFHVERLRPVAQILSDHGIRFGLEWVGPKTLRDTKTHPFIHTLEETLGLIDDLGVAGVGLLVDLFHLFTCHLDASAVRNLTNEQIVVVHVNDAIPGRGPDEQIDGERALPGETGVMDIVGFLQGLDAIGYDGPVTAEPFSARQRAMPAEEAVRETAETMQKCWRQAGLGW